LQQSAAWLYTTLVARAREAENFQFRLSPYRNANPLDDIRHTDETRYVRLNGRLYDAATVNQIAPETVERAPFWFENEGRATRRSGAI
jgi:hypothetical protein